MKYRSLFSLVVAWVLVFSTIPVHALTSKDDKWVITLKSDRLAWESPDWFTPFSLPEAPKDIAYWKSIIPYEGAQDEDMYIVMPTLWLITPVQFVLEDSADYDNMTQWREIDINKYLNHWVMHYPSTGLPWTQWNPVIFGHSNFFANGQWNYKTIFADIMNLDVWYEDEVWVYVREEDKETETETEEEEYELRKFAIEKSYETVPTDVGILTPQWGKELTLFACTNGLEWRWILRTRLIEPDETLVPYDMKFRLLKAIEKLEVLPEAKQNEILSTFLTELELVRVSTQGESYEDKFKRYLLDYFEKKVSR